MTTQSHHGFIAAVLVLLLMGFGIGQLMSSVNLLVGAVSADRRSSELAILGAAWCIGAILSPCASTVVLKTLPASVRLAILALLYLLPLTALPQDEIMAPDPALSLNRIRPSGFGRGALLCTLMFLIYGGIEASVSAWMPIFATRYTASPIASAQWVLSLFWFGLILGRVLLSAFVAPRTEPLIFGVSVFTSVLSLTCFVASSSLIQIAVASTVAGVCLAPLFPLLLSTALMHNYSNRLMGMMLACCALGSALFPLLLGLVSSRFSLRAGMLLPVVGLLILIGARNGSGYRDGIAM